MKKLSFLFVSLALVGFIALSSCKSSTQPTEPTTEEVQEVPVDEVADTVAAPVEGVEEDVVE